MPTLSLLSRAAAVFCLGLLAAGCASTTHLSTSPPTEYAGRPVTSGKSLLDQLRDEAPRVNPDVVFAVGKCDDQTGQYKDAEQLRYSRAVTQGCQAILGNYLKVSGFKVRESDPANLSFIAQEYQMSHTFAPSSNEPKNIGLVQHGGPNGGLVGANYMVTGSIISYASSTSTGGGGVDYDGIGVSVRRAEATVMMNVRIVDMSTGLTMSSIILQSQVVGVSTSFHLTRIIGDVATSIATIAGGQGAATILQPNSTSNVWSGEIGLARQLPVDYAVTDTLIAGLARNLEANQGTFYALKGEGDLIKFDYNSAH